MVHLDNGFDQDLWEPECKPSQYRLGAFTEDGRPTVIMDAFSDWSE